MALPKQLLGFIPELYHLQKQKFKIFYEDTVRNVEVPFSFHFFCVFFGFFFAFHAKFVYFLLPPSPPHQTPVSGKYKNLPGSNEMLTWIAQAAFQ